MNEAEAAVLRVIYTKLVVDQRLEGPLGAVVDLLTSGSLTRSSFDEIVEEYGVGASPEFRDGLLDLVLVAVREATRDHTLTTDEAAVIRELKTVFRVSEGEFFARRRGEIASILQHEVQRLVADDVVDVPEALYQEELQRIFDLGYDEFLELTRDVITPLVDSTIAAILSDGVVTAEERQALDRRLAALRTVYPLSRSQLRALGLP